jgi:outer membrane receptor protein involved in Fe transport
MHGTFKQRLLLGAAGLSLMVAFSASAMAQDASQAAENNGTDAKSPVPVEKVVVYGTAYRNRTNDTAPSLNYGLDYFQKFEPLTAGDALKRVPSVTFQSDVLEYDGARLRGLDPGYTQILINGEQVPGSGLDRSFFVDRIPAELIERVELVRSSSADRSGDAVAGAINIILRDALSLDGGYVKAGGLRYDDGDVKGSYGAVYGTEIMGGGRILLGGNIQGRHNPKQKVSLRYDGALAFDNREDQADVRDGTDYSLNGSLIVPVGLGELDLTGSWVRTDRTETENSREYDDIVSTALVNLQETSDQFEDIFQENWKVRAKFDAPLFGGKASFKVGYASFEDDSTSTEYQEEWAGGAPVGGTLEGTREFTDMVDGEVFASVSQLYEFESFELKFGADWRNKARSGEIREAENAGGPLFPPADPPDVGQAYDIEEKRMDPYVVVRGDGGFFKYEAGLRYETTRSEVTDRGDGAHTVSANDYAFLLPSAHALFNITEDDRIRASVARTVRRPSFDQISPALLEEEPTEDNDLVGNPDLKPESAWGFDLGYEHRIGRRGVAGINFFYRDVTNRIELASTGVVSSEGSGFVLTPSNIGNGSVMGVEIDVSTPLTFIGMENTGVVMNYSWLDSEVTDLVTGEKRRFNDQAEFVFNIGFIHDIIEWGTSFGSSYRLQGDQFNRILGESVETTYGADLEVFVEQRFGERFVLRLTGSNLLNAKKDETFFKYDTQADQLVNAFDEFELESEQSGPVFQLVGRYAF